MVQLKKTARSILVNENWYYINDILRKDDILRIRLIEKESSSNIEPVELPFSILYEDEDIMVVNKPAGMPTHPSLNNYDNTLANAVMYYFHTQNIPYIFRCVNRLDRDTTGLTILAKHSLSSAILSRQMSLREIHRSYLAIVTGNTPPAGTICAPIGKAPGSVVERMVDPIHGESATTHYERIAYRDGLSLVSLRLETGRTHQIRVHMKHIGHPLIGDFLYNPDITRINRQALHAYRLQFTHPITGELCNFMAPLPDDMTNIFPDATELLL